MSVNEDFLRKTFIDPGLYWFEQGKFDTAFTLFQQAERLATESGLTQQAETYRTYKMGAFAQRTSSSAAAVGAGVALVPESEDGEATFAKIKGLEREKTDLLHRFVYPLKWQKLLRAGKGLLLYGLPGTGKTFLMKAVANEMKEQLTVSGRQVCHVSLFVAQGDAIKGKYVGETEKNLKRFFAEANRLAEEKFEELTKNNPKKTVVSKSILFIDELESVGGRRGDDHIQVSAVNELLTLLQGAGTQYNSVIFVGATNFPWALDPAVLRRFALRIFMDLPSDSARRQFLEAECPWAASTDLEKAKALTGWQPEARGSMDAKVSEFIAQGHESFPEAKFFLGLNMSDLQQVVDQTINQLGIRFLQEKKGPNDCVHLCRDNVQCQLCDWVPDLKPDQAFQKAHFLEEFQKALKLYGSTVQPEEYVNLLFYRFLGEMPQTRRRREAREEDVLKPQPEEQSQKPPEQQPRSTGWW